MFSTCFTAKEQKSCEGVQSEGISWTTTLAGITNEESCPENLTGKLVGFYYVNTIIKQVKFV